MSDLAGLTQVHHVLVSVGMDGEVTVDTGDLPAVMAIEAMRLACQRLEWALPDMVDVTLTVRGTSVAWIGPGGETTDDDEAFDL